MAAREDDGKEARQDPPRIFGLVENARKGNNLGPFIRCSCAFGIDTVVAIGFDKCAIEGSHGAAKHVQLIAFPTHAQAAHHLRDVLGCSIIFGLIGPLPGGQQPCPLRLTNESMVTFSTTNVQRAPFTSQPLSELQIPPSGNIAVAFTKNLQEVSLDVANVCDVLFHIPHHSDPARSPPRPLLDAEACFSILLHRLTQKAGCPEHSFEGHKFEIELNWKQEREQALAEERRRSRESQRSNLNREAQERSERPELFAILGSEGDY